MRNLTEKEMEKVNEVVSTKKWVNDMVNFQLREGKGWKEVMWDVATAFDIVK